MKPILTLSFATTLFATTLAAAQHAPARVADGNPTKATVPAVKITPAAPQEAPKEQEGPTLAIGNPAPAPVLATILKGDTDFTGFKKGDVYIMEFWATWCGPCRAGMPHITKLQEKYKDQGLTIIGVSREELKTVKDFIEKPDWAKKTGYTIAMDKDSTTNTNYMKAAGQNGIPTAFVVGRDGFVEWIGHPATIDEPLAKIMAGEWNRDEYAAVFSKQQEAKRASRKIAVELRTAQRSGDWKTVMAIYDRELEKKPGSIGILVQKFEAMIGPMDNDAGYEIGWTLLKQNRNNASLLNQIAWYTVDDKAVKNRDLEFALAAAKAANQASGGNDPAILDTLARVYYERDDLKRAIQYQSKAADNAKDGRMGDDIKSKLKKYEEEAGSTKS